MKLKLIALSLMAMVFSYNAEAQRNLSKEQILNMTTEELSELPLEDLMQAVETLGVSSVDELFALIMNKNVSSASKEEEDSFTSPLSTTVITKAEMRTYGISTIEEAFRLIPGMIVTEKTNGIYDIQMRGLNNIPDNNTLLYTENANILIMVDGRQIRNCVMGALTMEMIPIAIEDVERIEVVRGACGALYGSNAVNGVINIITSKPDSEDSIVSGSMQMGNNSTYITEVALRKSWINGKLSAGLTFNIQHRDRDNNDLYVLPNPNQYIVADAELREHTISSDDIYGNVANGYLQKTNGEVIDINKQAISIANGGWIPAKDLEHLRTFIATSKPLQAIGILDGNEGDKAYITYNSIEPEVTAQNMFSDPNMSRQTFGVNGYISFVPNANIRFDISGGYGQSKALSSAMRASVVSLNQRKSENGYFNLNSRIYGLQLNFGYEAGPQDYAVGVPGYKIWHNMMNGNAEYTFKVAGFSIKPAFDFQWAKYTDYLPVFNDANYAQSGNYTWHYEKDADVPADSYSRLYGFLNGSATLYAIAPSVRLDYKIAGVRLIGAFRTDKTNTPDKWNNSWQFAANYSINNNNFIRLVYGRSNRGATLINTNINYQWLCTNKSPEREIFVGNKDADLVQIDNIELGYRWKPTQNVIVDAELYYSHSKNYGALTSTQTMMATEMTTIANVITEYMPQIMGAYKTLAAQGTPNTVIYNVMSGLSRQAGAQIDAGLETRTYSKYVNLPYKANQMGLSLNVDWIISPKLIAKINANVQQTTINNYYEYSKNAQIAQQMGMAQRISNQTLLSENNIIIDIVNAALTYTQSYEEAVQLLDHMMQPAYYNVFEENIGWNNMNEDERNAVLNDLYNAGVRYQPYGDVENPMSMYYAIKYNIDLQGSEMYFGSWYAEPYITRNNHKHKATPTAYGMIGLIYRPLNVVNISAFGNFIGKRTYATEYGSEELNNRFTLNLKAGYNPTSKMEIYFNAHNLFNNKKQEFIYTDKIGGIYTVGINFSL